MSSAIPFILCAGKGTRLRPLTDRVPKPLVPFFGKPILDYAIADCMSLNPDQIFINTHHLDKAVFDHVSKLPQGTYNRVTISFEPLILGSGGCLNPLVNFSKGREILIYNGDIIHDIHVLQFAEAAKNHANRPCVAAVASPNRSRTSKVYFSTDGELKSFKEPVSGCAAGTFSGLHLLREEFISEITEVGEFSSISIYERLMKRGRLPGVIAHSGDWFDLGLPSQLLEAHTALLQKGINSAIVRSRMGELAGGIFVPSGVSKRILGFDLVGPVFVESEKILTRGSGCIGPNVAFSGSTEIGDCCNFANVVCHDSNVPANTSLSSSLLYWNILIQM